jgi:hypothetical protein
VHDVNKWAKYAAWIRLKAWRKMRGEKGCGFIVIISTDTEGVHFAQGGHSESSLLAVMKDFTQFLDQNRDLVRTAVTGELGAHITRNMNGTSSL